MLRLFLSPARRPLTTAFLLVMATFVLSLSFRQRELGETGLDWQNGTKLAVWCAILCVGTLRWRDLTALARQPLIGLSFAYAAVAVLSTAWSEVPSYTFANAIGIVAYLLLACLAVRDLTERAALQTMLWSLAAYLGIGLVAGALALDIAWLPPSSDESVYRLQGLSGHPNTLGQQAAIFLTLTAIALRERFIDKRLAMCLLVFGLVIILLSGSRTNLAAAFLAWAVIALRRSPFRRVIYVGGMTLLAALLVMAATGGLSEIDLLLRSLSRTGSTAEIFTLTGRTELWGAAWRLIVEKPLFGWGYNGIEDVMARSVSSTFEGTAINAHNMLLQSLASLGFIGSYFAIAAMILLCIKFFTRPDPARDQIAVLLMVTGMGEVGMAATPILLTIVVFYFFARDGARGVLRA